MRQPAVSVFAAIIIGAMAVGAAAGGESMAPNAAQLLKYQLQPVKIVCFGDSITGVYYHTGGLRAYAEMLEIALKRTYPRSELQVINVAKR